MVPLVTNFGPEPRSGSSRCRMIKSDKLNVPNGLSFQAVGPDRTSESAPTTHDMTEDLANGIVWRLKF